MTAINYVRHLGGGGVVVDHGCRSQASPLPVGVAGVSHAEFWGGLVRVVTNVGAHWSPDQVPRPRAPLPGPVGQVARWFETAIAFARLCLCGSETAIAFAGAGRASDETAIAFAGEKWVFLVQFSGAEVSSVSAVSCWG